MSLVAITCTACGGAVALETGQRLPRCLFCDAAGLEEVSIEPHIEAPEVVIPFGVDAAGARDAFRAFTRSSIWYPSDLRQARVKLSRLLLPAWIWTGTVEGHYAGLVAANTRSGKRPVTGEQTMHLEGVLVPSSTALTRAELSAISPFDASETVSFAPEATEDPYELGNLSRVAAQEEAMAAMEHRLATVLASEQGITDVRVSCLYQALVGRPLLLPVFIGAYRRKDRVYRVVLNGQNGKLTGDAPLSPWRVGCAIMCVLMVLAAFALVCGGGAGLGALEGM